MDSSTVERVARALCEYDIRMKRRHDTEPARLEAKLPDAVDHAWMRYADQAGVAIAAMAPSLMRSWAGPATPEDDPLRRGPRSDEL